MSLRWEGVGLRRAGRVVLTDVDVVLERGRTVALCGPNGAGKSTLLALAAGDLSPGAGRVALAGRRPAALPATELAALRAVLTQHTELAHPFRVLDVLALGNPGAAERHRLALLEELEITHLAARTFTELSGGEARLVHLCRVLLQADLALAARLPEGTGETWLLLDEPATHLDLGMTLRAMAALERRARDGMGVVAVLHDVELASRWAERVLVLADGRVLADGPPEASLTEEVVRRAWRIPVRVEPERPGTGIRVRPG